MEVLVTPLAAVCYRGRSATTQLMRRRSKTGDHIGFVSPAEQSARKERLNVAGQPR